MLSSRGSFSKLPKIARFPTEVAKPFTFRVEAPDFISLGVERPDQTRSAGRHKTSKSAFLDILEVIAEEAAAVATWEMSL